jgi:hypothetical protein
MQNYDSEGETWGSIVTAIILAIMLAFAFTTIDWDKKKEKSDKDYEATTYPKEFIASYREERNE